MKNAKKCADFLMEIVECNDKNVNLQSLHAYDDIRAGMCAGFM